MDRKFGGILQELEKFIPDDDKNIVIEAKARQIIGSACNLIELIKDNYPEEEANDLIKRFIGAIKTNNVNKFVRKIRENKLVK